MLLPYSISSGALESPSLLLSYFLITVVLYNNHTNNNPNLNRSTSTGGIGAGAQIANQYCSNRLHKVLVNSSNDTSSIYATNNNNINIKININDISTAEGLRGGCAEGLLNQLKIEPEEFDY